MPFVKRDDAGQIVALSTVRTDGMIEELADDAVELHAFLARAGASANPLETSDLKLIRAIEDLIDVLIGKNVICITDLPVAVQTKLLERRSMRQTLGALNLISGTDETI